MHIFKTYFIYCNNKIILGGFKLETKKNVLFTVFDLRSGGTEKVLQIILDRLDYSKYNVDLLVLIAQGYYCGKINKNVNVINLFDNYDEWINNFKIRGIDKFLHERLSKNYDIQISFGEGFQAIVTCYFGNPHAKKICWIHRDSDMSKEYILDYKNDYYNMDKIVFVSQGCLNSFVKLIGSDIRDKCIVIQNPIDTEYILEHAKVPLEYTKQKFVILAIGRLCLEKGFHHLIVSHKKLLDSGFNAELIILGEGPDTLIFNDIIENLNIKDSVRFLGFVDNPYPFINMCDIFVSSSQFESYSLVIAEAMVLKKPILSTITVGSLELLKHRYGLLVDNSEEGIYQGLVALTSSQELREHYIKELENASIASIESTMRHVENLLDEISL